MRKKTEHGKEKQSTLLLRLFLVGVAILLLLSGILKVASIIAKSTFDGTHRYTLLIQYNAKEVRAFSLSPQDSTISVLSMSSKTTIYNARQYLAIPVDAFIKNQNIPDSENSTQVLFYMLMHYRDFKQLTSIDLIRLWFYSRGIDQTNVSKREITYPYDVEKLDNISSSLFKDNAIVAENLNIQIINQTDVTGLGNRLSRVISNMGGNVISVESPDQLAKHSSITFVGSRGYTVSKLVKITNYHSIPMQKKSFADIIITIGQDKENNEQF